MLPAERNPGRRLLSDQYAKTHGASTTIISMKLLFQEASQANELYRLIIDNPLDAFIAIDHHSRIVEWSDGAEKTFGWTKEEVLGRLLTDTVGPERFAAAHDAGLRHYLDGGQGRILGRHVEMPARRKDGSEIP